MVNIDMDREEGMSLEEINSSTIVKLMEYCRDDRVPKGVDEAVDILFRILGCEFGRKVIHMHPLVFSAKYHFTLGLYIRNCFGLWRKDSEIMRELNVLMADEASGIIMDSLWYRFRRECYKPSDHEKIQLKKTIYIHEEYID